jgi:hypothetical protein
MASSNRNLACKNMTDLLVGAEGSLSLRMTKGRRPVALALGRSRRRSARRCWHSWRSAKSAKEILFWSGYTLRNVVCFLASQGRSGPPGPPIDGQWRGVKSIPTMKKVSGKQFECLEFYSRTRAQITVTCRG